ncbi:glycosyltransferase family 2 protein [Corallincola luteus]|uniref:Glycosyltransferase family 2 protein n=1 Tax=Corallincola luteus TaxID=1775177 RepID=A0ABY2AQE3_9GAMM|nr:glycosyltransferase family A protein [Corallincola luteus]TCI05419.1 glycosyltransferase family 2 protein [Corallincola luteus]
MKTIVITHVYQQASPYLRELFDSIDAQTDREFDLLAFNYGLNKPLSFYGFNGEEVSNDLNLGLPDARDWALRYALSHDYELLILIDADDVMAVDRVEKTKADFDDKVGFYYTGLRLLSDTQRDFFDGQLPKEVTTAQTLFSHNFVGLSHFALNVKLAANAIRQMDCPLDVIAYDWFLASVLLLNGLKAKQVDTSTYYRIYDQNTAGFTNQLTPEKLRRTIEVKAIHYRVMSEYCYKRALRRESLSYRKQQKYYDKLLQQLDSNGDVFTEKLLSTVNSTSAYWWSAI